MSTTAAAVSPPPAVGREERPYWVALACLQLDPTDATLLRQNFATGPEVWAADAERLTRAGLQPKTAAAVVERRGRVNVAGILERLDAAGLSACLIWDPEYPTLLAHTHTPPLVLFYRGRMAEMGPTLAVVGTRRSSDYGAQVTWEICRPLAAAGVTIISGLALGIDTCAHRAALEAGGRTVAVLGGGADAATVYPPANRQLADQVAAKGGAVISESPPGTPPLPFRFPQRNRVIAGMSLGTLVVEAPTHSGALITAKIALEENREVLAVPGRLTDANAAGPLSLLADGATLVQSAADVLAALGLESTAPPPAGRATAAASPMETLLLDCLGEPRGIAELQRASRLPPDQLSATLTLLEVNGCVRRLPSGKFYRTDTSW